METVKGFKDYTGKNFNFRKAKLEDLKQLKKIYLDCALDEFKTQYSKTPNKKLMEKINLYEKGVFGNFQKDINSKKEYWIVSEDDKNIIGFALAKIKRDGAGWLDRNYVVKKYRRKGIGKEFVKSRLNWFKQNKIKEVYAHLFVKNNPSIKNLENFGFTSVEIVMKKEL
jgi:L-amino acid N-acyltransferase YncA